MPSSPRRTVRPPQKYRLDADTTNAEEEEKQTRGKRERAVEAAASPRRTRRATQKYSPDSEAAAAAIEKAEQSPTKKKNVTVEKRILEIAASESDDKPAAKLNKRVSTSGKEEHGTSQMLKTDKSEEENDASATQKDEKSSPTKEPVTEPSEKVETAVDDSTQAVNSTTSTATTTTTPAVASVKTPTQSLPPTPPRVPLPPLERIVQLLGAKNPYITNVDLRGQSLSLSDTKRLASALQACYIQNIVLSDCHIGDEGLVSLLPALLTCESLWLDGNDIGPTGAAALGRWLESTREAQLKRVFLPFNRIGQAGAKALASSLTKAPLQSRWSNVEMLDVGENQIGSDGAAAFGSAVASLSCDTNHCRLKELYLYGNAIGNPGAMALAKERLFLHELDLRYNDIGAPGAAALGAALRENTTLKVLAIMGNPIGVEGASAVLSHKSIHVLLHPGDAVP